MLERKINFITNKLLKKEYASKVHKDNIEKLSSFQIWRIFRYEKPEIKDLYLHNVIAEWYAEQKHGEYKTFAKLKRLIMKTKISLNNVECYEIDLLEERLFSQNRHIKALDVNFDLNPKEIVWIKFVDATIQWMSELQQEIKNGNLMFSQERIIVETGNPDESISIFYKNVKNIHFSNSGMEVQIKKPNIVFSISIHDNKSLLNTLLNASDKKIEILSKLISK